jgi:hypothetical protein
MTDEVDKTADKENVPLPIKTEVKTKKELLEIDQVLEMAKSIESESSTSYVSMQKWISFWTDICLQVEYLS